MSFFAQVKQFFGAGTLKVGLSVPAQVEKSSQEVRGKVTLNALSDQQILTLTAVLTETWSTGRGEEKETREFELGNVTIQQSFAMKQGETRDFDFVLPFQILRSDADHLKEEGGALGVIGKMGAFANAEKSEYRVEVVADVKGAALDPQDVKPIKLV